MLCGTGDPSLLTDVETAKPRTTRRVSWALDARALCLRLTRWLDGNHDELTSIRIASPAEQERRETTRRRQFPSRQIRRHGQPRSWTSRRVLPRQLAFALVAPPQLE